MRPRAMLRWVGAIAAGRAPVPLVVKLLTALVVVTVAAILCRRGLILSDEGYLLLQAYDITQGKVLYRDLDSFVAPGVWLLLAALFELFEPSVLVSRIPIFVNFVLTAWLSYRIVCRLADARYALMTMAVYCIAAVWAFPAWNFSFYSPYSVGLAIAGLERVFAWRAHGKSHALLAAGVCLGASVVFKQNYGVFAGAGVGIAVLLTAWERSERDRGAFLRTASTALASLAIGVALPLAAVIAYFATHGALGDLFHSLFVAPFSQFVGHHSIPYLPIDALWDPSRTAGLRRLTYGSYCMMNTSFRGVMPGWIVAWADMLHVAMYWIPPAVFTAGAWLSFRTWRRGEPTDVALPAVTAMAALVFLGVFPRADSNHVANVYQPVLLAGALVTHRWFAAFGTRPVAASLARFALLGGLLVPFALTSAYWMRDLIRDMAIEVPGPRGGVLVGQWDAGMLAHEIDRIRELTAEGEPVLTIPGLAMLNFLAERPMPSRYYNLYAVHIAHDGGAEIVRRADEAGVGLVVTEASDFFSDDEGLRSYAPELVGYVRENFAPAFTVGDGRHTFWTRRERPLSFAGSRSVLDACAVSSAAWARTTIREHLLVRSLYHRYGKRVNPKAPRSMVTVCSLDVPDEARLRVELSHRRPGVGSDARLTTEVWAAEAADGALTDAGVAGLLGEWRRLARKTFRIRANEGWSAEPPAEVWVDLSEFGGRRVALLLRSDIDGTVVERHLDIEGVSVLWSDVRVFSGREGATD